MAINVRAAAAARRAGGKELSALEDIAAASSESLAELGAKLKTLRSAQDGCGA